MAQAASRVSFLPLRSDHMKPFRAVSGNTSGGRALVLVVRPDGFDDEIELVRAVDLPEHAVVLARREDVGFAEVVQAVNATCRIVSHDEHSTGAAFPAREQEQMIGAEIEHGLEGTGGSAEAPARCQRR